VVWIDDHHDNNRSERALLADEGIRFILADSNDEVLGLIASGSVDLVISDMSRHNDHEAGLKLLKLLRSRNYDASVIIYVGNREAEAIGQAVELGAAAVINQPAELIEAVQIELAGNKVGPVKIQRAKRK
jgi:DNA-binding NtrC family response regulator